MSNKQCKPVLLFLVAMSLQSVLGTIYGQSNQAPGFSPILKKNSVYVELFGSSGVIYNISYDRIIKQKEEYKVSIANGVQYFPFGSPVFGEWITSLSTQVNMLYGNIHYFETGIGATYLLDKTSGNQIEGAWGIPFRFGYRYQKTEGGLLIKIAYTPTIVHWDELNGDFLPVWGGIALGWTF